MQQCDIFLNSLISFHGIEKELCTYVPFYDCYTVVSNVNEPGWCEEMIPYIRECFVYDLLAMKALNSTNLFNLYTFILASLIVTVCLLGSNYCMELVYGRHI